MKRASSEPQRENLFALQRTPALLARTEYCVLSTRYFVYRIGYNDRQRETVNMRRLVCLVLLAAAEPLYSAVGADQPPTVTIVDSHAAVEARIGDRPLLRYNKAHVEPPA